MLFVHPGHPALHPFIQHSGFKFASLSLSFHCVCLQRNFAVLKCEIEFCIFLKICNEYFGLHKCAQLQRAVWAWIPQNCSFAPASTPRTDTAWITCFHRLQTKWLLALDTATMKLMHSQNREGSQNTHNLPKEEHMAFEVTASVHRSDILAHWL